MEKNEKSKYLEIVYKNSNKLDEILLIVQKWAGKLHTEQLNCRKWEQFRRKSCHKLK